MSALPLGQVDLVLAEDTRVESTNLVRQAEGAKEITEQNDNQSKTVGMKDQKIAELEEHKGTDIARDAHGRVSRIPAYFAYSLADQTTDSDSTRKFARDHFRRPDIRISRFRTGQKAPGQAAPPDPGNGR